MPTIAATTHRLDRSSLIGWIGAIPFVAGLLGMLVLGWSSDRTRERRWHFAVPQLTAAVGLARGFLLPHSNTTLIASVHADWVRDRRLSPGILGAAVRIPNERGRGRGSWIHQLHRKHRRIFRAEDLRRSQSAHRLVQHRIRCDDRLLDHRVSAWCWFVRANAAV